MRYTWIEEERVEVSFGTNRGEEIALKSLQELYNALDKRFYSTLSMLKSFGIEARVYEYKYMAFRSLFQRGLKALEKGDRQAASWYIDTALSNFMYLRRDVRRIILQNYFFIPMVLVILIAFSTLFAKLFFEKKTSLASIVIFLLMLIPFSYISPEAKLFLGAGIRFMITGDPTLGFYIEPSKRNMITMSTLILLLTGTFISSILSFLVIKSEKLRYSLLLLKRRKLRFTLILLTVSIVSSAIFLHGAGIYGLIPEVKYVGKNNTGKIFLSLVKYQVKVRYIVGRESEEVVDLSRPVYFAPGEVEWLISQAKDYVVIAYNFISINSSKATVVATNIPYLANILKLGEVKKNSIIVSKQFALKQGISIGDKLTILGEEYTVVHILENPENIKGIDGKQLFYDPVISKSIIPDITIPYSSGNWKICKVILFFNREEDPDKILIMLTNLQSVSISQDEREVTGWTYYATKSDLLNIIEIVYKDISERFVADWVSQGIVIGIAALIIGINALASVYERKKDLSILSCIGARPIDLSFEILTEGAGIGIIGGIFGYVFGRFLFYAYIQSVHETPLFPSVEMSYFVVTVFIAVLATILGYLIPARKAVLEVVPSQLLKRSEGKVAEKTKDKIVLEPFLKLRLGEYSLFLKFLLEEFPRRIVKGSFWGFFPKNIIKREIGRKTIVIIEGSYKGQIVSKTISTNIIFEIDRKSLEIIPKITIESKMLSTLASSDTQRLVLDIRETLMEYIDYRKIRFNL